MTLPTMKVEVAFASSPDDPSPVWVDVSQWLRAFPGVSISRGRPDQFGDVQPSSCTFTLENTDGRFTPGNTASPYYPNVKNGRRVRVTATWNAVAYRRFTGYIDEWPVAWADASARVASVSVTATSRLARLGRGSELRSIVEEVYLEDSPGAYYPFGDPEGTTRAGNVAAVTQPVMSAASIGSGGSVVFGSSTGPGTDGLTAALFSPLNSTNGSYMRALLDQPVVDSHTTFSMECFFLSTETTAQSLVRLDHQSPGDLAYTELYIAFPSLKLTATGTGSGGPTNYLLSSAGAVNDGATHHALIRETISGGSHTATLFLDGVQVDTSTQAITGFGARDRLSTGGATLGIGMFRGTMSHVAVTPGTVELTAARIQAHSDAGLNGFTGEGSDARIERLAAFAGVPASEVTTETGLSTSIVNQITNDKTALASMSDVVATEGGVLFDARDGTLTFHARSHRYNSSSSLTLTTELQDNLEPRLDDQGVINDMTAAREGGVSVRAVDTASITDYGLYRDSITLLTTSDLEVTDAANWKVLTSSTPSVRVPVAEADLTRSSTTQKAALLAREIGDRITLASLPSQAPASSMDFFIEGYTEDITPETYRMKFNLSPASRSGVWQLDSSVYSLLDSTTRLGY